VSAIALIDYGAGNLTSVRKGFTAVGAELYSPAAPIDLEGATGIVVPGVGHFSTTAVLSGEWRQTIRRQIESGIPLFGICLGMQWLFEGSEEAPNVPGLGIVAGVCRRIDARRPLKVPHVGWNSLSRRRASELLDDVRDGAHVYFTHTFAAPVTAECTATTSHGEAFAAVVESGRVFGVQFHPEKSSEAGLRILRNFVRLVQA
jgi:imidazole glycerol-phosphate synthase subunit HisH